MMNRSKKLLTLTAALLLAPAAAGAQQALLWVPAGGSGAEEVLSALEKDKELRLTAALPALPAALQERIKELEQEGRLELALRPAGDPPLPLIYYPAAQEVRWEGKPDTATLYTDQYFMALRLGLTRDAAAKALGKSPAGLVSPPGGLAADYFPLARAMGVKWIACGPLASTAAAVLENGGTYAVPFVKFSSSALSASGPGFVLFDETSAEDPAALRALLLAELKDSVLYRKLTVSQALLAAVSTAATPAEISAAASPWSGDYTPWAASPAQAGALAALARTRADLMLHLNALQANYAKAEPAFNEYFSAEEGAGLLALASADPETAKEAEMALRGALSNAYRLMQKPAPPWIFTSLADTAGQARTEKMQVSLVEGGFELTNVARAAQPPSSTPGLPAAADPGRIWKLEALKVTAGKDGTLFQFKPGALDNSPGNASGFGHISLDLYMDVNHRPRAGITRPLNGRPYRIFPENAWEYALEINSGAASLYKITSKGPKAAGTYKPETEGGWIKVLIPPQALRGTPGLWGYAALLLAPAEGGGYSITDYIAEGINKGYIYAVRPGKK